MQSRRWMIFGFVHIAYGGIVWRKGWNTLQAGPIWGYEPLSSYILKEESLRIKAINESVSNENIINDNDNDENTIQKNRSELRKKEGFVKRWSLVPIEGPDRSRIRMQQEYGPAIIIKEKMKGKIIKQVEVLESAETVTTETIDGNYCYFNHLNFTIIFMCQNLLYTNITLFLLHVICHIV